MLIATWRLYARLHQRLADYGYKHVKEAAATGMPVVRPLFLVEPKAPEAWSNWTTYLYGSDIVVSPLWEKGKREATVVPAVRIEVARCLASRQSVRRRQVGDGAGGPYIRFRSSCEEGSGLNLGDLNKEWQESAAIAKKRPDLKKLDAELAAAFAVRK